MWVGGVKLYVVGFTAYQISKILFIIFANYYRTKISNRTVLCIELNEAIPNSLPHLSLFQYHYHLHLRPPLKLPSPVDIVVF